MLLNVLFDVLVNLCNLIKGFLRDFSFDEQYLLIERLEMFCMFFSNDFYCFIVFFLRGVF